MKIYRVTFMTKENRTHYFHVADVEAKNAKEAKDIITERWYTSHKAHAFDVKARVIEALEYNNIHRLTYDEQEGYVAQNHLNFVMKLRKKEPTRYIGWEEKAEKELQEVIEEATKLNRLDAVTKGIEIAGA